MPGTSNRQHRKRRPSSIENNFAQNQSNFHHSSENNSSFVRESDQLESNYNFSQQAPHNFEQNRRHQHNFCDFSKNSSDNYSLIAVPPAKQQPTTRTSNRNFHHSFVGNAVQTRLHNSVIFLSII